ncbi:hypothetical protein [Bacillus sp. 7884-1]|uniref:hypothetical protein n=1 Tax=Bacillus sp. 7884-1 TaxID=2021693 RepID=UPI000BA71C60|nr:hypothetical protein [Bacillus sp. 7884-1]PAE43442.1 hypothetical protein CHI06_06505 [Bacillus sp. 7884-1]
MSVWKAYAITILEILVFLVIGFILTENVLRTIYENFGISFMGNVWVNWFGVSYLLFFLYTIIRGLFINKNNNLLRERITSIVFWVLFIGSVYAILIPFVKGENPF